MKKILALTIGITFLVQIVVFLIGTANNVIISRLLGPESLGTFAVIIVLVEVIFKIVNPGIDTSAIYFISKKWFEFKEYVNTYFINSIGIIGLGIGLLLLINQVNDISIFSKTINLSFLDEFLGQITLYFFAFIFYEFGIKLPLGLEKFSDYNKIQLFKPIILFLLLITFSFFIEIKLNTVLILLSISFLFPAFFSWRSALPINLKWSKEPAVKSFRFGIKIMLANLVQLLNYRADILLISFFLSQTEVGWYYVCVIIGERLLILTQATSTILLPSASGSEEQREKTPILSRLNSALVFLASFVIGVSAYWLVPFLFSEEYSKSVLPLVVLLPGIISLSVSKILSTYFISRALPQYSFYVSVLNFILNISLNIIFIPKFGIVGAALSSTVSYTAALLLQVRFYQQLTKISFKELMLIKMDDLKNLKNI